MINNFYYDGDSFSFLGVKNNSGVIISNKLSLKLEHYGISGKSARTIIRSAVRYCAKGLHKDTFMCIGIGVETRLDYVENKLNPYPKGDLVMHEESYTHPIRYSDIGNNQKFIEMFRFDYMQTNILFDLIMLHDYLLYNNCKFIIHNLNINYYNDFDFPFSQNIKNEIDKRPRLINFYENSLHNLMLDNGIKGYDYKEYGEMAHPDEDGHLMYANFLLPYVEKYIKE